MEKMVQAGHIYKIFGAGMILVLLLITGCRQDSPKSKTIEDDKRPTTILRIPAFNADSAYQYIADQVDFGPRLPGSEGQAKAVAYYKSTLERYGAEVTLQPFTAKRYDGVTLDGINVLAKLNSSVKKRMLLCAHYDSRHIGDKDKDEKMKALPIPGADDGASGVGVILEIARQLQGTPLVDIGLDIVFFDAEDSGKDSPGEQAHETWCLGSQYWAKRVGSNKPRWGILLDMVGATDARFPKEGHSYSANKRYVDKIWRLSKGMGYGNLFVDDIGGRITDDHLFILRHAKIPMVDIIHLKVNGGFGFYHHTHDDDMDVIDKKTLKAVGQTTLATIYHYHNGTF